VTIIWANNAIEKQWLQITVKATANTGLATADVFYFGNAVGEVGNSTVNAAVNGFDEAKVRAYNTTSSTMLTLLDLTTSSSSSSSSTPGLAALAVSDPVTTAILGADSATATEMRMIFFAPALSSLFHDVAATTDLHLDEEDEEEGELELELGLEPNGTGPGMNLDGGK
jgi:hypothetical protein